MADLGAGPVAVLGQRLDEDRDATRRIPLVEDPLDRVRLAALPGSLRMARSMLSFGIEASLALRIARSSAGLPTGSPPPSRAATVIARVSFEN